MLSKVCSAAVSGIDAYPVEVEVNAGYGDTLTRKFDQHDPDELDFADVKGQANVKRALEIAAAGARCLLLVN